MGLGRLCSREPNRLDESVRILVWQQSRVMNVPTRAHELIMVMGVQRSGTNVLFDSLATDRTLSAFPEDIDSAFYCNFRLRPLSELAALIERAPGRILLWRKFNPEPGLLFQMDATIEGARLSDLHNKYTEISLHPLTCGDGVMHGFPSSRVRR